MEDKGPGLPDTELERIFDEFYRVDEARQRESGGHGLGLPIARRAVELHDGEISAHTGRKGLCVRMSFPVQAETSSSTLLRC
ncbi:ATP-binding protein [Halioglobus japonicus]|uniref:ATP-binding protein n=1 Tax=Halioglobus japonicus TaxID=930805 RepID=UPI0027E5AFA6|nr:ATP-binding protein [Halioglobus japonicus]